MMFREEVALYFENYMKHTNAFRGRNSEFYYVKGGGMYGNSEAVRVKLSNGGVGTWSVSSGNEVWLRSAGCNYSGVRSFLFSSL
jgi:hypothetical protein